MIEVVLVELFVKKCRICGIEFTPERFVELMKKRSGGRQERIVSWILRKYGPMSIQFIFVIQLLVLWCIRRYKADGVEEDFFRDCVVEVLRRVREEYDCNRGGILSFIHTWSRGEITKYISRRSRVVNGKRYVIEEVPFEEKFFLDLKSDNVEVIDDVVKFIARIKKGGEEEVYYKEMLWNTMRKMMEVRHGGEDLC